MGSSCWEPAAFVPATATVDPFVSRRQGGRRARKPPRAVPRAQRRSSRARRRRRRGPTRPESTAQLGNAEAVWLAPRSLPTCRRDPCAGGPAPALISSPTSASTEYDLVFLFCFWVGRVQRAENSCGFPRRLLRQTFEAPY